MRQESEKHECANLPALYRRILDQMGHCDVDFGQAMIEVTSRENVKLDFRAMQFLINIESLRLEQEREDDYEG